MSSYGVLVTNNHAAPASWDVGVQAERLRFSTLLPGGGSTASWILRRPLSPIPNFLGFNYDVKITARGKVLWRGRMEDFIAHRSVAGTYWSVTAYGYGVNLDDRLYTTQNVQNTQTSQIVADAITNLTEDIAATSITATGFTIANATAVNLTLLKAAQVVNWAKDFGDATNQQQIWYVYPDDDGTVRFTFKPRPATPDLYAVSDDFEVIEFGVVSRSLANRVVVQYNAGASFVTVDDTTLQGSGPGGWNLVRTLFIVKPEITQPADATQVGNALLALVSKARLSATSIRLKPSAVLVNGNGQRVFLDEVRAGMLVRLTDVDPAEGALTNLSYNNSFLIAGTDYDEDTASLNITPERQDEKSERALARAIAFAEGRRQP